MSSLIHTNKNDSLWTITLHFFSSENFLRLKQTKFFLLSESLQLLTIRLQAHFTVVCNFNEVLMANIPLEKNNAPKHRTR